MPCVLVVCFISHVNRQVIGYIIIQLHFQDQLVSQSCWLQAWGGVNLVHTSLNWQLWVQCAFDRGLNKLICLATNHLYCMQQWQWSTDLDPHCNYTLPSDKMHNNNNTSGIYLCTIIMHVHGIYEHIDEYCHTMDQYKSNIQSATCKFQT